MLSLTCLCLEEKLFWDRPINSIKYIQEQPDYPINWKPVQARSDGGVLSIEPVAEVIPGLEWFWLAVRS
jgi:hypothetical protein